MLIISKSAFINFVNRNILLEIINICVRFVSKEMTLSKKLLIKSVKIIYLKFEFSTQNSYSPFKKIRQLQKENKKAYKLQRTFRLNKFS